VETGRSQVDATTAAFEEAGLGVTVRADDESGGLVVRGAKYPNSGMQGTRATP
jgi:hypothetical protein